MAGYICFGWHIMRLNLRRCDLILRSKPLQATGERPLDMRSGIYSANDQPQTRLGVGGNYSAWLTLRGPTLGGLVIVLGCFGLSIAVHLTYALVVLTPVMSSLNLRARRGIQATLGAFFTFAGLKLLFSRP